MGSERAKKVPSSVGGCPDAAEVSRGQLRLTVLIPAHNESVTIGATLDSLWGQTRPPENVIVVADNCTDDTADIARQRGAEVFTTIGNREKKAGALNQALAECSPARTATTSR